MSSDDRRRGLGRDFLLASLLVAAGSVLSGLSLIEIAKSNVHVAQATQPVQPSPPAASDSAPADTKPGAGRTPPAAPEAGPPSRYTSAEGRRESRAAPRSRGKDGAADQGSV